MDSAVRRVAGTGIQPGNIPWYLFLANALCLLGGLLATYTWHAGQPAMRVGSIAGDTIVAQHRATYIDRATTAARKRQVETAVRPVYRVDPSLLQTRRRQATRFLEGASAVIAGTMSPAQKIVAVRRLVPPGVTSSVIQTLPDLSVQDFRAVQARSLALLAEAAQWQFNAAQQDVTEIGLLATISSQVSAAQRTAIGEMLSAFLAPTRVEDHHATALERQVVARQVPDVIDIIYPGEVIVRRGDLITPVVMARLAALDVQTRHTTLRDVLGQTLFVALILAMLFWYLHAFHGSIVTNARLLLLVDISLLGAVIATRTITPNHLLLPYLLPLAAAPTFAAALIAPEACVAIALAMAILAGWVVADSYELTLYYFLTSTAGVLAIRHVRHLKQFILAGLYTAAVAILTLLAFALVDRSYDLAAFQEYLLAGTANGFFSSTLALGGFALLSEFFGITTMLQLLELGQPNRPLLRRLMVKAPGTYNHSLIVASMVERAAEDIGADSLVAKVSALYHDVGKTVNPHCFVENQMGINNVHDDLSPEESARIIRGHVVHGLRLARHHKLPRAVLDAIGEHHGTMAISYFLAKAQQQAGHHPVDTALYTYPGPRPHTKETALLMLADGCESAVRASADHSQERIRDVVRSIFEDRIRQGQLDGSPLTLHDLNMARDAFCAVLNGLYHPRIDYPEMDAPHPTIIPIHRRESSGA